MKEYAVEERREVNLKRLVAPPMPKEAYIQAHQYLPISCHDVLIEYQGGILLIVRDNFPVKDIYWMVGGRINRGLLILESLKKKVKEECGLEIDDIIKLGAGRTLFTTDPFGHGKGTDTVNWVYFARGKGRIKLDKLHTKPTIIKPADYTPSFRRSLHPYVRDFMDKAMKILQNKPSLP